MFQKLLHLPWNWCILGSRLLRSVDGLVPEPTEDSQTLRTQPFIETAAATFSLKTGDIAPHLPARCHDGQSSIAKKEEAECIGQALVD